jgi:hypothetical protein
MVSNPCQGRRLPHTRVEETIFLTPAQFTLVREHIDRERWKNLATWLVSTGMRFSEATALTASDIDADAKTCRINKAWKYSGDYRPQLWDKRSRIAVVDQTTRRKQRDPADAAGLGRSPGAPQRAHRPLEAPKAVLWRYAVYIGYCHYGIPRRDSRELPAKHLRCLT